MSDDLFIDEHGDMQVGHFYLVGPDAGKDKVILDKYRFVKGHMQAPMNEAKLISRILCRYYPVKLSKKSPEDLRVAKDTK